MADVLPPHGVALLQLHALVTSEQPRASDAIVWLQGNGYDRGPKVLDLFMGGFASIVVITGNRVRSSITVDHLTLWLTDRGVPTDVIVIDRQSLHTRDQAVRVLALAQERGWRTLLLVASPHHQLRAFLTFVKRAEEIGWTGRVVNQPAAIRWDAIPSEQTRTGWELLEMETKKLSDYPSHVASAQVALTHVGRAAS
ncbi:YdcF family protein [Candidatus Uhrbacteria bacterium]|nr:YdcF family protein [Candidatus Uhrbacteria bacterium]